jgi:hypothetical protein
MRCLPNAPLTVRLEDNASYLSILRPQMGKFFILVGTISIGIGLLLTFMPQSSAFKIGRLPGDFYIKKDNFTFYFPLTTSILLSVLLTLVLSLLSRK